MTSAVASIGVEYDATDLQESDLSLFLEIVSGLSADGVEIRGVDVTVPSLAGRIPRNRKADTRKIELRGHIQGQGSDQDTRRSHYRALCDQLAILFTPIRDPAALVVTLEDGAQRTIDARPLPSLVINEQVKSEFAYVSVVLESVDPDWADVGS